MPARGRLHLHADHFVAEVRYQVVIRGERTPHADTVAPTLTSHCRADSSPRSPCLRGVHRSSIGASYIPPRTEKPWKLQQFCYKIPGPARRARADLRRVPEPLGLRQRLELLEGVVLDLPDALASDVERAPDLLEREGRSPRSRSASRSPRARARAALPGRGGGSRGATAQRQARTAIRRSGPRRSRRALSPPPPRSAFPATRAAEPCVARLARPSRWCRARAAISSGVGSRPNCWTSCRST